MALPGAAVLPRGRCACCARQDSNLGPTAPEAVAAVATGDDEGMWHATQVHVELGERRANGEFPSERKPAMCEKVG